jgi:hypothetical protein
VPMPGPKLADRRSLVRPTRPRPAARRAAPRTSYAPPHRCGRASFTRTRPRRRPPAEGRASFPARPCWGAVESPRSPPRPAAPGWEPVPNRTGRSRRRKSRCTPLRESHAGC